MFKFIIDWILGGILVLFSLHWILLSCSGVVLTTQKTIGFSHYFDCISMITAQQPTGSKVKNPNDSPSPDQTLTTLTNPLKNPAKIFNQLTIKVNQIKGNLLGILARWQPVGYQIKSTRESSTPTKKRELFAQESVLEEWFPILIQCFWDWKDSSGFFPWVWSKIRTLLDWFYWFAWWKVDILRIFFFCPLCFQTMLSSKLIWLWVVLFCKENTSSFTWTWWISFVESFPSRVFEWKFQEVLWILVWGKRVLTRTM